MIHRYNLRILPRVGAGIAELALLRELRLVAAGADRSIEVQRHGLGAGADYAPPHSHFPFAHLHGRAIIVGLVGIVIVRFHPGNEIVATCGVVPIVEVASIQILRAQRAAELDTVVGSGHTAAMTAVVGEQLGVIGIMGNGILQHLAVLELGAVV